VDPEFKPQYQKKKKENQLSVVVHICNPSTQEAEAEGLRVQVHPGLHSETLFQKRKIFIPGIGD
jgi:hypothetical protein